MTQGTAFGEASLDAYLKVEKANGTTRYIQVVDGQNIEITEAAYLAAHKENN